MGVVLSTLRDWLLAVTFGWLGVTLQGPEDAGVAARDGQRGASAMAVATCPREDASGAGSCPSQGPTFRTDCPD